MRGMKNFYPGTGTTLCPHCGTRFKITRAQLEAHHGMVRCGHCLQTFDTRPYFAPEETDPQLKLPILDEIEAPAEDLMVGQPAEQPPVEEVVAAATDSDYADVLQTLTSADLAVSMPEVDQAMSMPEEDDVVFLSKRHSRLWTILTIPLLLLLFGQATYLFRIELAAYLPSLKPALLLYCQLLECSVPLPQRISLMSIESSELQEDPTQRNQIILIALLRNRAPYTQAFPNLELTLNDSHDKALARRILRPEDYLPASTAISAGLPANQELSIKLRLDTVDIKPMGYRLALYYLKDQAR